MSMKRILLLMICSITLFGCNSTDQKKVMELYEGLDAKETYQRACDYFDETVSYYKELNIETPKADKESNPGVNYAEVYKDNGKKSGTIKYISNAYSLFTVFHNNKYYEQFSDNVRELTEDQQKEYYDKRQGPFIKPLLQSSENEMSKTTFVSVERHDKGDDIIISVKYKKRSASVLADGTKEWSEDRYNIMEVYIGKNKLIYKIIVKECDENFENEYIINTNELYDFNKKSNFDYDKEVKNLKKYENMNLNEFKSELGI